MNIVQTSGILGIPVEADVAVIERELTSFWESTATPVAQGAVVRACSCNIVAIVQKRQEAELLPAVLAKVAEYHPSRSLIVCPDDDRSGDRDSGLRAWITAYCSTHLSGGPQICSEAITITARGSSTRHLPNMLVSLIVPGLPVFLYCRSLSIGEQELAERVAAFSHLLIIDSHQSKEDPENRLHWLELLLARPAGVAVRDLNWSRITAWRDLIAQFFDSAASRHYVNEISAIDIFRNLSSPGNIPTRTLLLTGWLASRLGWRLVSARRSGDQWSSRWKSKSGEVVVRFTGTMPEPGQSPGISSVTLRTRTDATFSIAAEHGSPFITATASAPGFSFSHSVPQESLDEAYLLIRELSQAGEDAGFKAALTEAVACERAFLSSDDT